MLAHILLASPRPTLTSHFIIGSQVLRSAVTRRYLRDDSMRALVHQDLARFFGKKDAEDITQIRRMQEQPEQWGEAGVVGSSRE